MKLKQMVRQLRRHSPSFILNYILKSTLGIEIIREGPREATLFAKSYFKGKKIRAIEIGVLRGKNAKSILENLNIDKLFLIDPYEKYGDYEESYYYDIITEIKQKAIKKLKNYKNKIEWIFENSSDASKKINVEVDFIYIDGNHQYKYIKKDLENYWKLTKGGGIMSGHDIDSPDVIKALMEFCNKNKLEFGVGGRDWWIKKISTKQKIHAHDGVIDL